jgi:hypothetical protein
MGGKSTSFVDGTFCGPGVDCTRPLSRAGRPDEGTFPPWGDSCPGFAPLCRDEGLGTSATGGATCEDFSCDVTPLAVNLLKKLPIGRKD